MGYIYRVGIYRAENCKNHFKIVGQIILKKKKCSNLGCPRVGLVWVWAQPGTDLILSGGWTMDLPPTVKNHGSSQIKLGWTAIRSNSDWKTKIKEQTWNKFQKSERTNLFWRTNLQTQILVAHKSEEHKQR